MWGTESRSASWNICFTALADYAYHSKEHTQELLQNDRKLFTQIFNHKEDEEKLKEENLYCCIIYIKNLWQSQAYY